MTVNSGRAAMVFNVAQNRYRLIAAVRFHARIVYTLMILMHMEYDRNVWRDQL